MDHPKSYTTIDDARIMTLQEALEQYKTPGVSTFMLEGLTGDFYVFDNDAHFESLDLDKMFYTKDRCGVLFRGNLTVDGLLTQPETDYGPFTLVLGNVSAKNIFMGGGYIRIEGNVTVEQTLYAGCYNHGMSDINGDISAEVVLSSDHSFNFHSDKVKKGVWLSDIELKDAPAHEAEDVLNKGYWSKAEESVQTGNILKAMAKGTSILKPNSAASPVLKRLEKALLSKNKRADLSKMKLKRLPKELFELKEIQQLNLSDNPLESLGDELATMEQVTTIELSNCYLQEVPEVLSRMPQLESLNLAYNNISTIPDTFATLQGLKKLSLFNCQLTAIPAVLKDLPALEVLNIDYQKEDALLTLDSGFQSLRELHLRGKLLTVLPKLEQLVIAGFGTKELPEAVMGCKKLKKLDIANAGSLAGLPDDFSVFQQLEEITFNLHEGFQNVKVLATLPKLKTVNVRFASHTSRKRFLELLEAPQWSVLCVQGSLDDSTLQKEILNRPNLKKLEMRSSFGTEVVDIAEARKWLKITI